MIETQYERMIELGLCKEGDAFRKRVFKECIGEPSNRRWNCNGFDLNPMQCAILDTMYDAGEGETFTPKQLLNDATRKAYLLSGWTHRACEHRKQTSCGHDEQNKNKVTLYKLVDDEFVEDEVHYIDNFSYGDESEEYQALSAEALRRAEKDGKSAYYYINRSSYYGECAWENINNPDNGLPCKHHGRTVSQLYAIQFEHKERGFRCSKMSRYERESDFNIIYFDDQDLEALLTSVSDEAVIIGIKSEIPKMRTDARNWLKSVKRGQYGLTWWWRVKRIQEDEDAKAIDEALHDKTINGWTYRKGRNTYHRGNWEGKVTEYQLSAYNWRRSNPLKFITLEDAQEALSFLESHALSSRYKNGEADLGLSISPFSQTISINHERVHLCHNYTPQEYYEACHAGTISNADNTLAQFSESDE